MTSYDLFVTTLDTSVRQYLQGLSEAPEVGQIEQAYNMLFPAMKAMYPDLIVNQEEVVKKLADKYVSESLVTKRLGFKYCDRKTKPWVAQAEERIHDWYYWDRYKRHLASQKKWAPKVIKSIERDTYQILDLLADPAGDEFDRRGLVVASVQSGKTSNYTGLVCRAADAGYKVIVVMAGVHNLLRNQTQQRLEEGFTGFNLLGEGEHAKVGVGILDFDRRPVSCTSRKRDFDKKSAESYRGMFSKHSNEPLLFVVKKNSNSLGRLYEWMHDNCDVGDPLLLIDDEADNATINGKYKKETRNDEVTRINGQIRNILDLFSRSAYVGYTATPFANVLIDPETNSEDFGRDVFPESFIYTLEDSSDYFGAKKVFDDYDSSHPKHFRGIYDIDLYLPPKHKSDTCVSALPPSLLEAMNVFFLANAIRLLRGDGGSHSTMMVNVSPYTTPQNSVADLIEDQLKECKDAIRSFAALPERLALSKSAYLQDVKATWDYEYSSCEFPWEQVQQALPEAVRLVKVIRVNSGSQDALDYEDGVQKVIAVGGYRLSRGLTLEGLVVSYYSRNAKAYDALMQMGRWFGYRFGYEDLCRVWMSEKAAGWYSFIADATDELISDLRDMRQVNSTPRDYGLKIQSCPSTLIVTARNKMGAGTKVKGKRNYGNGFVETVALERDASLVEANKSAAKMLIDAIEKTQTAEEKDGGYLFNNVDVSLIKQFFAAYFNCDGKSPNTTISCVNSFIDNALVCGELKTWDVFVAKGLGSADKSPIALKTFGKIRPERRFPGDDSTNDYLVVGEKHRLASRGVEKAGLTPDQQDEARNNYKDDNPGRKANNCPDRYYRALRERPLLVLHPVEMAFDEDTNYGDHALYADVNRWESKDHAEWMVGWSMSLPKLSSSVESVDYIFNAVAMRNEFWEESDEDYEDDGDTVG